MIRFSPPHTSRQNESDPDALRAKLFGNDSVGRLYYRFEQFRKEMRVYR